jgi:hydroxyethylthiazole kinase
MLKECLENMRARTPLIHSITNYVTVNDCANVLLACGCSPVMADDIREVEEIVAISNGLNINIGTLNHSTIASMSAAGKKANVLGLPAVLDPVGAGASTLRTETALMLMNEVRFSVIKGNISEMKTLTSGSGATKGVDADLADLITDATRAAVVDSAKAFARETGAIIVITGTVDIVTDGTTTYAVHNGHPMLSKITGTGCMLSAMMAAYVAANPDNVLEAALASVCAMGLCGEKAHARMGGRDGNATFKIYLIDALYSLCGKTLESGAQYEIC